MYFEQKMCPTRALVQYLQLLYLIKHVFLTSNIFFYNVDHFTQKIIYLFLHGKVFFKKKKNITLSHCLIEICFYIK